MPKKTTTAEVMEVKFLPTEVSLSFLLLLLLFLLLLVQFGNGSERKRQDEQPVSLDLRVKYSTDVGEI